MPLLQQLYRGALILLICLIGLLAVGLIFPFLERFYRPRSEAGKNWIKILWCRAVCRTLHIQVTTTGEPMNPAGLVVCNHISWLDVVILGAQSPVTFVAKSEIEYWPLIGYLVKRIGTLFVVRGDRKQGQTVIERMTWLLRHGETVIIFPEGTTTDGSQVLRFHARYYQPAILADQPLQAVAIHYQQEARRVAPFIGDDSFLPHLLEIMRLSQVAVQLNYCNPVSPHSVNQRNLANLTRTQIVNRLELADDHWPMCG